MSDLTGDSHRKALLRASESCFLRLPGVPKVLNLLSGAWEDEGDRHASGSGGPFCTWPEDWGHATNAATQQARSYDDCPAFAPNGREGAAIGRREAHEVAMKLWSELQRRGDEYIDLTREHRFKWKEYIQNFLSVDAQQVVCCGDLGNIDAFRGEIHKYTGLHFVHGQACRHACIPFCCV